MIWTPTEPPTCDLASHLLWTVANWSPERGNPLTACEAVDLVQVLIEAADFGGFAWSDIDRGRVRVCVPSELMVTTGKA
ncbi:MAG: hypothetical protein AAGI09_13500 [Pseudomonadota bacterium]